MGQICGRKITSVFIFAIYFSCSTKRIVTQVHECKELFVISESMKENLNLKQLLFVLLVLSINNKSHSENLFSVKYDSSSCLILTSFLLFISALTPRDFLTINVVCSIESLRDYEIVLHQLIQPLSCRLLTDWVICTSQDHVGSKDNTSHHYHLAISRSHYLNFKEL